MFLHPFLIMIFFISLLHAEPSVAQIKQAVSANPSLLNTPQAKTMMKKKGVSLLDVKQKLSESKKSKSNESNETIIENNIDTTSNEKKIATNTKKTSLSKRINPFRYKSNDILRMELNEKQQLLTAKKLSRYSMRFYANKNTIDSASLPTPDNYIISVGDSLNVHIYGDRDTTYNLKVKNDGTIELAFIGPVHIGGMQFKNAKKHLKSRLKAHYKMSFFNIKMNKYSTIQVTLIGDIKYPGLYNLSSFSTVKDLLINAKGIKKSSSIREIIIKRNSVIIGKLDFYDLLFKGDKFTTQLLKHGDIVIINKAKKLISIDGYVNNNAIFELTKDETLNQLIEYAGGIKPNASKLNIKIDRYTNNSKLETFKVSFKDSKKFKMCNGDKVYIYPLDFTAKNSVNIYGNIIRPGTYNLSNNKTLYWLFKRTIKDGLKSFFLPNTYFEYGILKRYSSNNLTYTTQSFNLTNVLKGIQTIKLKPNDKIFIFSQNDIFSNSYITTKGKTLVKAGKLQYVNGITIQDAINASGIDGVLDDKIRVTTYNTDDFMPKTSFYSLKTQGDTKLNPYDEVEVYDYYSKNILEPVSISGQVVKQTSVYYEKGMSVQELLNMAGGFNKQAYTKSLSITRYYVDKTQTRQQKVLNYNLEKTTLAEIKLEPYDQVKISKILGWNAQDYDVVSITGEVNNPVKVKYGTGLTLSDLIVMAGGLTKRAYSNHIEIVRYSIDANQTRQREILKIDTKNKNLNTIKLTAYDEVKIFKIPKWGEKSTIVLNGEVKFPGTYNITTGEKLSSVIERAGGYTDTAFIEGAVFTRESIKRNQVIHYNQSLAKIKRTLAIYNAMPANSKDTASMGTTDRLTDVMNEAKKYQPLGRVSIALDSNLTAFHTSEFNLVLKNGDKISIPSKIDTITVFGEVFNPGSFVYSSKLDGDDYIELASGYSRAADSNNAYVIHADGRSEPLTSGWCSFDADISKGDTIVIPIYIKEQNNVDLWNSVAKLLSSFALTAAAINSLGII